MACQAIGPHFTYDHRRTKGGFQRPRIVQWVAGIGGDVQREPIGSLNVPADQGTCVEGCGDEFFLEPAIKSKMIDGKNARLELQFTDGQRLLEPCHQIVRAL